MAVKLLTVSEYARHRGCDEKAVRRALSEGRIVRLSDQRQCIDPEVADIQWARNTRARADSRATAPGGTPATSPGPAPAPEAPSAAGYNDHRIRREKAEADMAELESQRQAGKLLDREVTESAVFEAFRTLRDATFSACRSAAPLVLGLPDVREIQHVLEDAQRAAFADFEARMRHRLQEMAQR